MKKILMIVVISLLCTLTVLAHSNVNNFRKNTPYITVHVSSGETVWSIALKYVTDKEDIRDFIVDIVRINSLDNNAHLYPGQALKVPVESP